VAPAGFGPTEYLVDGKNGVTYVADDAQVELPRFGGQI
jgi:hypothetical protein